MRLLAFLMLISSYSYSKSLEDLQEQINALAEEIESMKINKKAPQEQFFGLGIAASKVYNSDGGTTIGGYGEITLNSPYSENENGNSISNDAEAEALRNVLYIGHKFNEQWILNTEIEIEHVDEIFLEFAFIDYLQSDEFNFRTGLILAPLGLVNELHEPIFFNSVNRPELESKIIPSTWRELGFGPFGRIGKLTYKVFLLNGLDASGFSESGLRGGRKKGGVKENASTVSLATRLDYQINNDLNLGLAAYIGNSSSTPTSPTVGTSIYQTHFEYKYENWYLKGIYVLALLDDVEEFNSAPPGGKKLAEELDGAYLDLGYKIWFGKKSLTPFVRYETYDTHKKVPSGITKDLSKEVTNITIGAAYRPIEKIIFKLDYTNKTNQAKTGIDEVNLSLGYIF